MMIPRRALISNTDMIKQGEGGSCSMGLIRNDVDQIVAVDIIKLIYIQYLTINIC